jgi:DNA-binding response OmpR family regulator
MASPHTPGQDLRVLVVDGHADAADSLALLLGCWGHQARAAYDGQAALALAEGFRPAVVLTELYLPKGDAFTLARALGRQAVLVALTTQHQEGFRRKAREAGFCHYFVKPADLEQLQAALLAVAFRWGCLAKG